MVLKKLPTKRRRATDCCQISAPNPVFIGNFFQKFCPVCFDYLLIVCDMRLIACYAWRPGATGQKGQPGISATSQIRQVPLSFCLFVKWH